MSPVWTPWAYGLAALGSACAAAPQPRPAAAPPATCAARAPAQRQITLYFGRGRPGGEVSDSEWARFVAEALAPRFPKGFTVWDAAGQWQDSTGVIVHERSKVVRLIAETPDTARRAVEAIVGDYRRRFQQEAVLQTEADVCVGWT